MKTEESSAGVRDSINRYHPLSMPPLHGIRYLREDDTTAILNCYSLLTIMYLDEDLALEPQKGEGQTL
jgi:hypothetical protein